jgi:hypothetical protein
MVIACSFWGWGGRARRSGARAIASLDQQGGHHDALLTLVLQLKGSSPVCRTAPAPAAPAAHSARARGLSSLARHTPRLVPPALLTPGIPCHMPRSSPLTPGPPPPGSRSPLLASEPTSLPPPDAHTAIISKHAYEPVASSLTPQSLAPCRCTRAPARAAIGTRGCGARGWVEGAGKLQLHASAQHGSALHTATWGYTSCCTNGSRQQVKHQDTVIWLSTCESVRDAAALRRTGWWPLHGPGPAAAPPAGVRVYADTCISTRTRTQHTGNTYAQLKRTSPSQQARSERSTTLARPLYKTRALVRAAPLRPLYSHSPICLSHTFSNSSRHPP